MEEQYYGVVSKGTRRLAKASAVSEWFLRAAVLFFSLVQSLVIHSNKGIYCIEKSGILAVEGQWIQWLIILQLLKVIGFPIWEIKYVRSGDEEAMRMSSS